MVVYVACRALTTVLKTVARIPRHQTASQDRSGKTEKPTSFDLAHISPFQEIPASRRMRRQLDLNQDFHFDMLSHSSIHPIAAFAPQLPRLAALDDCVRVNEPPLLAGF